MKRLSLLAVAIFNMTASASVFAQQNANPSSSEPPYGYYHHMWGGPWGYGTGMIIGPIMMILILIGIVTLIVLLVRGFGYGASHHWYRHAGYPYGETSYGRRALDILEERFAKGEIEKAEFEEKRKLLGR